MPIISKIEYEKWKISMRIYINNGSLTILRVFIVWAVNIEFRVIDKAPF